MVLPLVAVEPTKVVQSVRVVAASITLVFVAAVPWPNASPRMNKVAWPVDASVPVPEVVTRRLAPLLSNEMTLCPLLIDSC